MGEFLAISLGITGCLVLWMVWRTFVWAWWTPMKMKKYLSKQGLEAPPYTPLLGNFKDTFDAMKEATSKPLPLNCHDLPPYVQPFLHQSLLKYGKVFYTWFGVTPRINVMDPDVLKEILVNKNSTITKKKINPVAMLLATGVANYEGEKWARHRRIITPAFHLEKLKIMLPAFRTSCSELLSRWEKLVSTEGQAEIDAWPDVQSLTADVISRTAFGTNYEHGRRIFLLQREQGDHAVQAAQAIYFPGYRFLPTKRNKRMKEIASEIKMLVTNMINEREKAVKEGNAFGKDFLSVMLDSNSNGQGISREDVVEECKLFYLAGQESTSTLLLWTLVLLSMHQEWQERAREEVLNAFGTSEPDFDGLNHLKIVPMILYEVLRLYPSIVLLARNNHSEMKIGNATIPPGVELGLPVLLMHHDKDLWGKDAHEFKPERFGEGISKATNNRTIYFPFGWGQRVCLGQSFALLEAKMTISMVLQRFTLELSPTYVHAPIATVTLHPRYGAQLIIRKRI